MLFLLHPIFECWSLTLGHIHSQHPIPHRRALSRAEREYFEAQAQQPPNAARMRRMGGGDPANIMEDWPVNESDMFARPQSVEPIDPHPSENTPDASGFHSDQARESSADVEADPGEDMDDLDVLCQEPLYPGQQGIEGLGTRDGVEDSRVFLDQSTDVDTSEHLHAYTRHTR